MTDYFVRIELFDAEGDEYEKLYEAMEGLGFKKTIQAPGGPLRALPTGTYVGQSQSEVAEVRDWIRKVANPLSSKDAAIFVCAFSNWASYLYTES